MTGKYDNELVPGTDVSPSARKALDRGRNKIRQRAIERGIVQFRADRQFMEALLDAAADRKIPPGVLSRNVIWQFLQNNRPFGDLVSSIPSNYDPHAPACLDHAIRDLLLLKKYMCQAESQLNQPTNARKAKRKG